MQFEVGKKYNNPTFGDYTVLSIKGNDMLVQLDGGGTRHFTVSLQTTILERVEAETIAQQIRTSTNETRKQQRKLAGAHIKEMATTRRHDKLTPRDYREIGFLLARLLYISVLIPPDDLDRFADDYTEAKGHEPDLAQHYVCLVPEDSNQWWYQVKFIFKAQKTEYRIFKLFTRFQRRTKKLRYKKLEVEEVASNTWRVGCNQLYRLLLGLGFNIGAEQDEAVIRNNIPNEVYELFNQGYIDGKV
jgi:hypothetical protein